MTQPLDDFDHLNQIARYRNRLDDIREWRAQLPDVMLTISGYSMDLTGIRGTTQRIPGGDALAMLGPWAPDADHGDDLPHPDQIIREWTERLTGQTLGTWTENWRWLHDHTPNILQSPAADAWRADIDALWHRLERLSGNHARDEPPQRGPEECYAAGKHVPGSTRVTLAEADRLFEGIRNRVDVDRHHERTRAKNRGRSPEYKCQPDQKGRYLVADLREHYGATRYEEPSPEGVTSV